MFRFAMIFVAMLAATLTAPQQDGKAAEEKKEPDPKLLEPTAEQLAAAKEAYAKHAAEYEDVASTQPAMKREFLTTHIFTLRTRNFKLRRDTTDDDLKGLPNLPFYFAFCLSSTKVTEQGMKELNRLTNLTSLNLSETNVTDAVLKELKDLKNLRYLNLKYTKVTDVGLKELSGLRNLKELILRNPDVRPLRGFTETPVTEAGVQELQRALPKCRIYR